MGEVQTKKMKAAQEGGKKAEEKQNKELTKEMRKIRIECNKLRVERAKLRITLREKQDDAAAETTNDNIAAFKKAKTAYEVAKKKVDKCNVKMVDIHKRYEIVRAEEKKAKA